MVQRSYIGRLLGVSVVGQCDPMEPPDDEACLLAADEDAPV
jgi:hypothetical protein